MFKISLFKHGRKSLFSFICLYSRKSCSHEIKVNNVINLYGSHLFVFLTNIDQHSNMKITFLLSYFPKTSIDYIDYGIKNYIIRCLNRKKIIRQKKMPDNDPNT